MDAMSALILFVAAGMTAVRYTGGSHLATATLRHDPALPLLAHWDDLPALLERLRAGAPA